MWKVLGVKLLTTAVNMLVGKDIFKEVADVVRAYVDLDMSGEEKKAAVKKELEEVKVILKRTWGEWANAVLNMVIEVALGVVTGWQAK